MISLSDMRCVVFGGGGFIGTNLCRSLVGKVDSLKAFGRRQSFPDALDGVAWIPGDFTDPTALAAAVSGCDVVFHLVTSTTPASSNVDKVADLKSNVVSTLRLLDACKEEGVRRVVFVSSGGTIYGIPSVIPTSEDAPTNPITAYGVAKLAIEKYLALYEHLYGIESRILRVANPYGAYQTAMKNQGAIAAFMLRALEGKFIEIWGDGSVTRDYIYIDDVVNALQLAAVHEGPSRIFNIGSGKGYSLLDVAKAIEGTLEKAISVHHNKARPVDVPCSILDIGRAKVELDWAPKVSLQEGLLKTAEWMEGVARSRLSISKVIS